MATGLLQRYGHVRGAENVDSYLNQPRDMGPKSSESSARKTLIEKEPEFLHREMLLVSLAFPFGIMMAFGGKTALLVLCFGALIAYIFDILGTIEVRSLFRIIFIQ